MKAVLQRVSESSVTVGERVVGRIGEGALVYLGIGRSDTDADVRWMVDKIVNLRIFPDAAGTMNESLLDTKGAVLVVSQFTLYGDARKGRRPSWSDAAPPETALPVYERFVASLRARGVPVECGAFGMVMRVRSVIEGPVTILLDSPV